MVRTRADDIIDLVKDDIKNAAELLSEFLIKEPWGYNSYSEEYKNLLVVILQHILNIKSKL